MRRAHFLTVSSGAAAAVAAGGFPILAAASSALAGLAPTLNGLLAPMPAFARGQWLQYSFESAPAYVKRIGFGIEHTSAGTFHTIETQVGGTEYACDPNTIKKSYLSAPAYGNVLAPHDVRFLTVKAGVSFMLAEGTKEDALWLLDTDAVYSTHTATIAAESSETVAVKHTSVQAKRLTLKFGGGPLRTMTIWLAPSLPGGVARLEASVSGQDPFAMRLHAHGAGYQSLVTESFDELRKNLIG
jgi:hypothetical protein